MKRKQKVIVVINAIVILLLLLLVYRKHECNRAIEQQAIALGNIGEGTLAELIAIATYRKNVCGN